MPLKVESHQEPDVGHPVRRRLHLEKDSVLVASPGDEIHAAVEIGIAEVEPVSVVVLFNRDAVDVDVVAVTIVGLETAMAQAKARSGADIRHPLRSARGAGKK